MQAVKRLKDLAQEWAGDEREVVKLTYDSRACVPGSVFFAFNGIHTDGANFIEDAIRRGAIAVVTDHKVALPPPIAELVDFHVRTRFALMCSLFYDEPEKKLSIIGVTGTDGKSTTCDFLYQLLTMEGIKTGLLGTVAMDDGTGYQQNLFHQSTPEADKVESFLSQCVSNGVTHVILECTSHALSPQFDRLHAIRYDGAIVTTVTSEHLEFHKTIKAYVDAKCNLVRRIKKGGFFISTTLNPHLDEFLQAIPKGTPSFVVGKNLQATVEPDSSLTYQGTRHPTPLHYPILASNALLAAQAATILKGTPLATQLALLKELKPVDGRMVCIPNNLGLFVIVDYAHTADAYEKIFSYAFQRKGNGRILACFGCAGERDTSKRAAMGNIASHYGDVLYLTEEDPRWESDRTINQDMLSNAEPVEVHEIDDRAEAIRAMVKEARKGDVLLFLGKGHEHSIEKQGKSYPWDEKKRVQEALKEKEENLQNV